MKRITFFLGWMVLLLLCTTPTLYSQSVGINTTVPDGSAALDVTSTTQGILVPRLTTAERTAVSSPATGLLVFDSTTKSFWFYTGSAWTELVTGSAMADNLGNHTATANIQLSGNWLSNDGGNEGVRVDADGNTGIGTNSPAEKLHVSAGNFLVGGIYGEGPDLGTSGAGTRMFFYPKKAAFRAGRTLSTEWDDTNIGDHSIALGREPKASGAQSVAIGSGAEATAEDAVALGYFSRATGVRAFAVGEYATASATNSTAFGYFSLASGTKSFASGEFAKATARNTTAFGYFSQATGDFAFAGGEFAFATGSTSIALGQFATASGAKSHAFGQFATASGDHSFVANRYTTAKSYAETVFGQYNTDYAPVSNTEWNVADRLFSIGNGTTSSLTSDAMVVLKNGNTGIGTNTPVNKLDIEGGVAIGASYAGASTAPSNGAIIQGKLGIGTADPVNLLDIQSASSASASVQSSASTAYLKAVAPSGFETGVNFSTYSSGNSANRWLFGKSNTSESGSNAGSDFFINRYSDAGAYLGQPFRITRSTGYVGIGGILPSTALEVNGTTKTTNFQMTTGAANGYVMKSDASGNAGWTSLSSAITQSASVINSAAQTLPIEEGDIYISSTISGITGNFSSSTVMTLTLNITCAYDGYLTLTLINPDGDEVILYPLNGAVSGDNFTATVFSTEATSKITNASPPYTGTYLPSAGSFDFLVGGAINGTWRLKISNASPAANGTFHNMTLNFAQNTVGDNMGDHMATGNLRLDHHWLSNDGGNEGIRITSGGRVGVGTSAPETDMHIYSGTASAQFLIESASEPTYNLIATASGHEGGNAFLTYDGDYKLRWNIGKSGDSETGNNEGSDFFINRHSDNGAYAGQCFFIDRSTGNVGIGSNTTSAAKLVVNGSASSSIGNYGYLNSSGNNGTGSGTNTYSIYASARIAASEFNAFSDARIKKIRGLSDGRADLQTLLNIKVTDYQLKDSISKGNTLYKKVIAQQVEKVYPQAVTTITDVVPDIYRLSEIKNGRIELKDNALQKGDKVKLIFGERTELVSVTAADASGFSVGLSDEGSVFVYGREVSDFRTVDYEALSMLNISATQELIKMVCTQNETIENLKTANRNMQSDIDRIKAALNITLPADNQLNASSSQR